MIDKLVKEFEKIRASLTKSKKLILADIDKIDEKYRKLAQEEKKNLTESLSILNEQLKYYDTMLGGNAAEGKEEESETEEEPVIEDTIFPENNEDAEVAEKPADDAPVNTGDTDSVPELGTEQPAVDDTKQEEKKEKQVIEEIPENAVPTITNDWPSTDELKVGEDGWPEWPEA